MQLHDIIYGLLQRFWFTRLKKHHKLRHVQALFTFINGYLSIGIIGLLAWLTNNPFLFPSLGPTAFLLFYRPLASAASPRNTLIGHAIGMATGWLCFKLFEHQGNVFALEGTVSWTVVGAVSLSVGFTFGLMVLFNIAHPPAGATTLLISLGMVTELAQFPVLLAGVGLLLLQAYVINRLAGIPYPVWNPTKTKEKEEWNRQA